MVIEVRRCRATGISFQDAATQRLRRVPMPWMWLVTTSPGGGSGVARDAEHHVRRPAPLHHLLADAAADREVVGKRAAGARRSGTRRPAVIIGSAPTGDQSSARPTGAETAPGATP